jgi:lysophospholipase L1-like esterase
MKKQLAILAALAALSSFGAIRAVTPDGYGNDPNCWQMKRHNEKMALVARGGAKVVFIGDSITHGWEGNGADVWKKYFAEGPRKALNLGTSADRTEHVLWRITEGRELDGYEAKVVFLMIGTNNSGHFPFEKEPPSDTIVGIREILKTIRAKQPTAKIVLTAIFPRGADKTDACRRRNEIVNKEIAKYADGETVFWLDFNDQFLTRDGRLPREIFPDLLHPGPHGYEIWASAVLPYVDAALAGLPMPPNRWAPSVCEENVRMDGPGTVYPLTRIMHEHGSRGKDWWSRRLLEKRSRIADSKGEFDLVFFGDSITHYWENQGAASLAELRKTYSVLNLGYGGDRTEHLVWRGENGELDGYTAKCVMLMIGTNNRDKAPDTVAGIRRVLDIIARKQPQAKVLLLPIFPRGANAEDVNRKRNEQVNAEIVKFADGKKVVWVDFNAKFLDAKGDTQWCMPDRLHPNAEAYRDIWLPAVLPHFREIVGK